MQDNRLEERCSSYLRTLCREIPERCVGSEGNRRATAFFQREISSFGWQTEADELDVIDWEDGGASLRVAGRNFRVLAGPYSLGCSLEAPLVAASSPEELERTEAAGRVLLLHGPIAAEQLMPKNFVFYNPEEHRKIIALLERKNPAAIVSATGRNPALAGGVYPFPLIEDGDFDIPSVYTTEETGRELLAVAGKKVFLESRSVRVPAKAYNVTAGKGKDGAGRIVFTAHIDAKKGSPGAIDNASGVAAILLLAGLLRDYDGKRRLEIVALNGEDHYSAAGQMAFLKKYEGAFGEIALNINIDGAGYKEGGTAFSLFNLPPEMEKKAGRVIGEFEGISKGEPWFQGDHGIFIQRGRPAIAVTSRWFLENMATQSITHTGLDIPEIVDCRRIVEIARALNRLVRFL